MNLFIYAKKASRKRWLPLMGIFMLLANCSILAQEQRYTAPSLWFGAAGGANINFHSGVNRQLNKTYGTPVTFGKGDGVGLYLAPLMEYRRPYSRWGFMFQAGFDSREASLEEVVSSCNCPADLNIDLSYVSIESSVRFSPILNRLNFYLYAGPRLAFNVNKSFTYQQGINPETPQQTPGPAVKGDLDNIEKILVSMQVGAGYDIPISSKYNQSQVVFSPFIAYHPYFGQSPRLTEAWDLTTLRVGATLKFGRGRQLTSLSETLRAEPNIRFYVMAPANIPAERIVKEVFPLRNYVFFDLGSTDIPERYVRLRRDQARNFREDQLELFPSQYLSSRSQRQMLVYYNVLNILGDRLVESPSATIRLVGSSASGFDDAMAMATSIQSYLVNTFGIDASRITAEGRNKPQIPSEQPGATRELELLRQGDRRVSIESSSEDLLAEFQRGPDTQLRPVEIRATQSAPPDSYVSIVNEGASEAFQSWSVEIKDNENKVQRFGPYTQDWVAIPGKSILGTSPEGYYNITMQGISANGYVMERDTTVRIALWTPPTTQEGLRFSVLFEFNESKSMAMYEKYLTEVIAPKIPQFGTVIIHGYTDIIGNEAHNQKLSLARASDVWSILRKSLVAAGRTDVKFEVYGFGEDPVLSPFDNQYPEGRFYNRTVVIDIIPAQ